MLLILLVIRRLDNFCTTLTGVALGTEGSNCAAVSKCQDRWDKEAPPGQNGGRGHMVRCMAYEHHFSATS